MSWCSLVISLTINLLARGKQVEVILHYPDLERDDIQQAVEYAALLTWERICGEPLEATA